MIIYGTGVKQLQSEKLTGIYCSKCGREDAMFIFSYVKYAHIFWIPVVPVDKFCVHACGGCSKTLQEKEMPPNMKMVSDHLKQRSSFPWWSFIGLIIIIILILWGIATSNKQ